ncbi:hypothetical protein F4779DRAFT_619181 [Xylariaceae sp. FL0662B]|nr:hypothetical protein F4779DRAFT_619181 [Xylariaceae sp. FL0662B]
MIQNGIWDLFVACNDVYGKRGPGSLEKESFWQEVWCGIVSNTSDEPSAHKYLPSIVHFYAKSRECYTKNNPPPPD